MEELKKSELVSVDGGKDDWPVTKTNEEVLADQGEMLWNTMKWYFGFFGITREDFS